MTGQEIARRLLWRCDKTSLRILGAELMQPVIYVLHVFIRPQNNDGIYCSVDLNLFLSPPWGGRLLMWNDVVGLESRPPELLSHMIRKRSIKVAKA